MSEEPEEELDEDTKLVVYKIHGDVKKIEQHLEQLNGAVSRHEEDIGDLSDSIEKNQRRINYGVGAVALASLSLSGVVALATAGYI